MNLRGRKENNSEVKPLTDKTNIVNINARKKKEENALNRLKNVKTRKARKTTSNKALQESPKTVPNDENTDPVKASKCDCFGFNDSDLFDDAPAIKSELTAFDCSKPYRLALYVRPSKKIRLAPQVLEQMQKLNPSLNLTNMTLNSTVGRPLMETTMSPNRSQFKVPFASTPKEKPKGKLRQMKMTDVFPSPKRTRSRNADENFKSYFESSGTSDEDACKSPVEAPLKKKAKPNLSNEKKIEENSTCFDEPEPVTFRRPNRRSYVKKSRPEPEPEDDTPTEEVLKSIQKSKKKKNKKAEKEDEEFEKWSRSMNSMFDEVDQFEISIN